MLSKQKHAMVNEKVKECCPNDNVNPTVVKSPKEDEYKHNYELELIDSLNRHIEFLQKELEGKDSIIKMILSDRTYQNLGNCSSISEQFACKKSVQKINDVNTCNSSKNDAITTNNNNIVKKIVTNTNPFVNVEDKKHDNINNQGCNYDNFNLGENRQYEYNVNVNNIHRDELPATKKKSVTYESRVKKKASTRSVTIVGDSLIRDVKAHDLKKIVPRGTKVYVRPESGAIVADMIDYVNPSRKHNPDLFILHAGTNDLRSGKQPIQIAHEIIDLARSLKKDDNDVAVSAIVQRGDAYNEKGKVVNNLLKVPPNRRA